MHPYLPHLLSDIAAATRAEQPLHFEAPQSFEEEMEEVERWVEGEEPAHTFGYWCGLQVEQFPPAHQFTKSEQLLVCTAFDKLLSSWNLDISLPDNLPPEIRYAFMVNTLNEKTEIPRSGFMGFDFCTGYAPDCVFKEYCPCLKIWNKPGDEQQPDIYGIGNV
jgi:hypothetical protein